MDSPTSSRSSARPRRGRTAQPAVGCSWRPPSRAPRGPPDGPCSATSAPGGSTAPSCRPGSSSHFSTSPESRPTLLSARFSTIRKRSRGRPIVSNVSSALDRCFDPDDVEARHEADRIGQIEAREREIRVVGRGVDDHVREVVAERAEVLPDGLALRAAASPGRGPRRTPRRVPRPSSRRRRPPPGWRPRPGRSGPSPVASARARSTSTRRPCPRRGLLRPCPPRDSSAITTARFVARKVLPVPPFEENTEMTIPRCDGFSAIAPRSDRRFSAQTSARSTASRSSSLPCVRSTTSRMPARIAAGSNPFHDLSRTMTIAVIGAARPTNSARPSASGSLTSGESTRTSTGSLAATRTSSAAVTL